MDAHRIRIFGDPVLRRRAAEVDDVDGRLVSLADDMLRTMYDAPGLGLAAPQVGIGKRLFVYDIGDGPRTLVNPVITESDGEWVYEEGCLSVPGLSWEITRPKQVHVTGRDLDGNEVSIEADELEARLFQHELDHLDGILLIEHLDDDTRRDAMRTIREVLLTDDTDGARESSTGSGLRLPLTPWCRRPPTRPVAGSSTLGSPEVAVPPLRALIEGPWEVVLVVDPGRQAPRAAGASASPPR
ncbi:MAG: peptide deformylase [Acidimicrobiia bacterium]|nr:peptide deformylase [Acidimicrobiia bacterium]